MARKGITVQEAINQMKQKRHKAMEEAVTILEADAKLLCPVDTGTLKRSITHDVESTDTKTVGSVGTNVEYAVWVDREQPYLSASLDKNLELIRRKIAEVLKK